MAEDIINQMPKHDVYLEPFAGSLAVFLNKPRVIVETVNDIDGRLVNMFKQMRDNPEPLARLVYFTLFSRAEYNLSIEKSEDLLEDARRMLVRCWFSIGGKTCSKSGWRRNVSENGPYNTYEWKDMTNRIFAASERLRDAQIECKDAIELIKEYNRPNVLIYADPPYMHETRVSLHYENEMNNEQHRKLIKVLKEHSGPVILSGYQSNLYEEELSGWNKRTFSVNTTSLKASRKTATEVLWVNPIAAEKSFYQETFSFEECEYDD